MAGTESSYDSNTKQVFTRKTTDADDAASAVTAARVGSTAGANLGAAAKKSAAPPPKQSDFGGDMGSYMTAMRKYREDQNANPALQSQKKAIGAMSLK